MVCRRRQRRARPGALSRPDLGEIAGMSESQLLPGCPGPTEGAGQSETKPGPIVLRCDSESDRIILLKLPAGLKIRTSPAC